MQAAQDTARMLLLPLTLVLAAGALVAVALGRLTPGRWWALVKADLPCCD